MTTYISPIFATGQEVDAALTRALTSVQEGDLRLTDSRNPLPHTHPSAPTTQVEYAIGTAGSSLTLYPGNGGFQYASIPGDVTIALADPPSGEAGHFIFRYRVTSATDITITWPTARFQWLATPALAVSGGTEGFVEFDYGVWGWRARAFSPSQTDWTAIKALSQMVGYWDPGTGVLTTSGDTPPLAAGNPVGYYPDLSGKGKHAVQTVTANKPVLRQTSTTKQSWLEADSTDALNITLPAQLTNAAIFRVTAEGVTVDRSQTVATTYNLLKPYAYNGPIAIFDESSTALTTEQVAQITQHMRASVPSLTANLLSNSGFDVESTWTLQAGWSISGGVANRAANAAPSIMYQAEPVGSGAPVLVKVDTTVSASAFYLWPMTVAPPGFTNGSHTHVGYRQVNGSFGVQGLAATVGTVDNFTLRGIL